MTGDQITTGTRPPPDQVALGQAIASAADTIVAELRRVGARSKAQLDAGADATFHDLMGLATRSFGHWVAGASPEQLRATAGLGAEQFASLASQRRVPEHELVKRMLRWRGLLLGALDRHAEQLGSDPSALTAARQMAHSCVDVALVVQSKAFEAERQQAYDDLLVGQAELATQARLAEDRLSQLQTAQAQLVQAQKLESIGQLAAGIAHEINTPMQFIGDNTRFVTAAVERLLAVADAADAVAATVDRGAADAGRLDELAATISGAKLPMLHDRIPRALADALTGVEDVARIVVAMKRFSHPGSAVMEPVDVNESISTTLTVCRGEWKHAAGLTTDLAGGLPLIEGRRGALNQVWLNLIVNASQAVAERYRDTKGAIAVATRSVDGGQAVEVSVQDDGAGIPPDHLERIFDPFFTTKEIGKGTGQGLAIAHQTIVTEHNGRLDVESTTGQGTRFVITLPVAQPAS